MQEDIEDREDEIKMQQAINHRRKTLLQVKKFLPKNLLFKK